MKVGHGGQETSVFLAFRHFATVSVALWISALVATSVCADERPKAHEGPGPAPFDSSRPPGNPGAPDIDTLRKALKESAPGSAAYWTAAHGILNALGSDTKRIDDIESELADRRKTLFQELRKARANTDNKALEKTAQSGSGDARDAARAELDRRVSDPNVHFVIKEFGFRPERALQYVTELVAALNANPKDEKKVGELLARMLGQLRGNRRDTIVKHVEEALKSPEKLKEKGLSEPLLKAIYDTFSSTQGNPSARGPIVDAFTAAMKDVEERNKKFHLNVARVVRGGEDGKLAKAELLRDYSPEAVADFVNTMLADGGDGLAVDTARAFAREDNSGNLFLDLEASNFAFGDKDRNQSLFLGNKDDKEQIRAALAAFQTGEQRGHDGELVNDFNGAKTDRLQRFRLAAAPAENPVRVFAGEGEAGKPALRRSNTAVPTDKVAKLKIATPNDLPTPPPPVTPTPTPTATPTGKTPPRDNGSVKFDEVKTFLSRPKCQGCHPIGNAVQGDSIANMVIDLGKVPGGRKLKQSLQHGLARMSSAHINAEERAKMQEWINAL